MCAEMVEIFFVTTSLFMTLVSTHFSINLHSYRNSKLTQKFKKLNQNYGTKYPIFLLASLRNSLMKWPKISIVNSTWQNSLQMNCLHLHSSVLEKLRGEDSSNDCQALKVG